LTKKESDIINQDNEISAVVSAIQADIGEIEQDASLYEEKNFDQRIEIVDFLEFHIIDQIEELLLKTANQDQLILLKYRAEKIKSELEEIDTGLFQKFQANIRAGKYAGREFNNLIHEYVGFNLGDNEHQEEAGYDNLDIFINGIFSFQAMPEQTKDLEPEMVFYQKTPARIIFELVENPNFTKNDVFFDLGSGLGQAAILVNLLTGIKTKGIEFEPAFCDYAKDCATQLSLPNVTFINTDAREANYSEGTIFFMYTPFKGEILEDVLEILRKESLQRKITIITYGPCTAQVALQNWLDFTAPNEDNIYKLCFSTSL